MLRKGFVSYFKNNGITAKKKTCECKPWTNCQKYWERSEQPKKFNGKTTYKEKPYNECKNNLQFYGAIYPLRKDNVHQKDFVKNFGLLIFKNHLPIQVVDSIWLKHLVM